MSAFTTDNMAGPSVEYVVNAAIIKCDDPVTTISSYSHIMHVHTSQQMEAICNSSGKDPPCPTADPHVSVSRIDSNSSNLSPVCLQAFPNWHFIFLLLYVYASDPFGAQVSQASASRLQALQHCHFIRDPDELNDAEIGRFSLQSMEGDIIPHAGIMAMNFPWVHWSPWVGRPFSRV